MTRARPSEWCSAADEEGGGADRRGLLAGTKTRRVKRALFGLFDGAISKDVVSRAWRKVKTDWEAWCARGLAEEDIVRLILDGTVVKARIDRKATAISVLAAIGVRRDGQKVLLAIRNMGGEKHGGVAGVPRRPRRPRPEGAGLRHRRRRSGPRGGADRAVAGCAGPALHGSQAPQPARPRAQVAARRAHRGLPRHDLCRDEGGVARRRTTFLRKWRLKCRAVADSLEEAGDRLFTFTRLDPSQWKSARTTNTIERLHEEFRRRIRPRRSCPTPDGADAVLGALGLRPDRDAKGRRMGNPFSAYRS